ncbi:MAG: 30S ribosomal protein S2 [Candidatus Woesebacteria bacterium GW2011_GWB1_41_10]|uniref:Small ribosomal subunit protein uS2 n=1 Tax=Candidatus Woesebacteria bacterium GW2011_GWB1_41_10 TaxID=1618577 RepID=A0A0G0U9U9_9BACT|nr:MAG: 30S ribosomal protein S2 [Candidatus Woesebacteria bacterium GW2011_GWB1_41_10]
MAVKIKLEELLEVGAHFGHQTKRWNPKMEEYLYGSENGVHIFDLTKTKAALEEVLEFLKTSVKDGKTILLVGTKKQIKEKIKAIAEKAGIAYVNERWLGGTISNFDQMRKSLKKLAEMKEKMASGGYSEFTKKERLLIEREITRLERFFGGLTGLEKAPDVLFIVDTKKEISAVREASRKGVTVIGLVDSNSDPDMVDYVIPMNDDAAKAVEYVLDKVGEVIGDAKSKRKPVKKA